MGAVSAFGLSGHLGEESLELGHLVPPWRGLAGCGSGSASRCGLLVSSLLPVGVPVVVPVARSMAYQATTVPARDSSFWKRRPHFSMTRREAALDPFEPDEPGALQFAKVERDQALADPDGGCDGRDWARPMGEQPCQPQAQRVGQGAQAAGEVVGAGIDPWLWGEAAMSHQFQLIHGSDGPSTGLVEGGGD